MKRWASVLLVIMIFIFSLPHTASQAMNFNGMGMHSGMSVRSENEYFLQMIPHHEEAIEAAEILFEKSERAEMKEFAETIIRVQSEEIKEMRAWLAAWYPENDQISDYQPMMRDLNTLAGDELDRAFLADMIPHHMAAVMMSQQFLARGLSEHAETIPFAKEIRDAQRDEIHQMMNWMSKWC